MISVDVRAKRFGSSQVLKDIRFSVAAGETVAILGPSGIGKTTLLRLIAGIDPRFDGQITRPENTAIVFQEPVLLPWRSVIDNILLIHPHLGRPAAWVALDEVGLGDKADLFPSQISLGQQRRLSLARGFAGAPELLIMDEPFVSLDAQTAVAMLDLTEALITKTRPATIFVTHAPREAERLATRIFRLGGSPATMQTEECFS